MRVLIGFCAVAAMASSSAAAEDIVLEPNQKWVADYGEHSCRLIRSFGDKDKPTVLVIQQTAPTSAFSWTVAGPDVRYTLWHRPVSVQWGPQFDPYEKEFEKASLGTVGSAYIGWGWTGYETPPERMTSKKALRNLSDAKLASAFEPTLAEIDIEQAARVEFLSFQQRGRRIVLRLDNFGAAVSALNECTRKLAAEWGFDESYYNRLTTTPVFLNIEDVAQLIQRDYPSRARSRGAQALFRMRIIVGADGKPERCDWLNETEAEDFVMKRTPCDIVMQHAKYDPAVDESGEPIRSITQQGVRYSMHY